MKLEKDLEKYLVNELKKLNIDCFKGNSEMLKGFPDRIVFAKEIWYIELKRGKEMGSYYSLTPMQKYWKELITNSQGNYRCLVGKTQVDEFIKEIKKGSI